ncbi:hypothetical protein [Streptomyces sp. NPDC001315]|uniref:hypothetical protein n=1 Tax=Streptomyces sp. NPDC001315 TaxID=3364562 RepID=UPI003683E75A
MPQQLHWKGIHVPYITPWSAETPHSHPLVRRGPGIAYLDEIPFIDRCDGVLWQRMPATRGIGRPNFAGVHALRQRQAMRALRCQVCGEPTTGERTDQRSLFLVHADPGYPIREGEKTVAPPVHQSCAHEAIAACPHLRNHAAALVTHTPAWGVAGILYDPNTLQPLPGPDNDGAGLECISYDDPRIHFTIAAREIILLHDIEEITLNPHTSPT